MSNSVYVLNEDLQIVGDLLNIAPGERIYSARFVGDTLYLVTFRQMDPLFVIDLRVPSNPKILGELTMPGFSSYLHPVDSDHILGIGSENGSVKVSLYDVSDPTNPLEESKYLIPGYSYSEAQYDHKAVLFDLQKNLLVIPVNSWSYVGPENPSGAYVFDVSLTDGIRMKGVVQHDFVDQNYSDFRYSTDIRRSLYIGDYLYTIGMTSVKASSLADLTAAGFVTFEVPSHYYGVWVDTLLSSS
jgi:inhibitor of cysteine peptidase